MSNQFEFSFAPMAHDLIKHVPNESLAFKIRLAKRCFVHSGKVSHQDEQVAVAIAVAVGYNGPVERVAELPADITDNDLVLDVGGVYDPERLRFDHHQRSREETLECAYSLLAQDLGIYGKLCDLFPWASVGKVLDCIGPFATAKKLGADWTRIQGFYGYAGEFVSKQWAENASFRCAYTEHLANEIATAMNLYEDAVAKLKGGKVISGLRVCDMTQLPPECHSISDTLAHAVRAQVIMFNDDRGEGLGLLRVNDDPHVDFSRCKDMADTLFAHATGFIMKTKTKDADVEALLAAARVD